MLTGASFIAAFKNFYPAAKAASGGTEIVCRCPFCGDSHNLQHSHLYISVPISQDDISMYHCKRCNEHGILNDIVLRKLNCNDTQFIVDIVNHNNKVLSLPKYSTIKSINIYPLRYNWISNRKTNAEKLEYINKRIGSNFSEIELSGLKIFLNLYDIITQNKLELTRHQMVVNDLDQYFIGFISYDNSYAGLRKITDMELYKTVNKRYINYALVNKMDSSKNYYIIPSDIDITNPLSVKIHLAEGQFDVLSIFYNLNHCNRFQNIYIACGGKSYRQALEFILTEFGLINYEVHYYPDRDVSDQELYYSTISRLSNIPSRIVIHRNIMSKDFGVPMNQIKEYIEVIK